MSEQIDVYPGGVTAFISGTWTQSVGTGSLLLEISPGQGSEFEVLFGGIQYTGTNSIIIGWENALAGNPFPNWTNVASVASATAYFPEYEVSSNIAAQTTNTVGWPMRPIISGTNALRVNFAGAGAGTDAVVINLVIRIKTSVMPTITKTTGGTAVWTATGQATFQTD